MNAVLGTIFKSLAVLIRIHQLLRVSPNNFLVIVKKQFSITLNRAYPLSLTNWQYVMLGVSKDPKFVLTAL